MSEVPDHVAPVLRSAVRDILAASVPNNRLDAITGFLLCDGVSFAQALEGPRDNVEDCFARICADPRNSSPSIRDIDFAEGRCFPRWSMCALTLSERDDALLTAPDIGFDLARLAPGALMQHLSSLALRHGPELDRQHEELLRSRSKLLARDLAP